MAGLPALPFRLRRFGLHHDCPAVFYTPQYRMPMPLFVAYKMAVFGGTLGVLVFQFGLPRTKNPWVFFTNWSYILQCSSFLLAAAIGMWKALKNRCRRPDQSEIPETFGHMHWYLKARWVLHNIASTTPYLVTLVYWTFLWPHEQDKMWIPGFLHSTIQVHGVNSILALLDLTLDRTPIKMHHFHHPLLFVAIYGLFSIIYSSRFSQPIYPFLDWSASPGWATLCSILIAVIAVCFMLVAIVIKKLQLKYCCLLMVSPSEEFLTDQTPLLPQDSLTN